MGVIYSRSHTYSVGYGFHLQGKKQNIIKINNLGSVLDCIPHTVGVAVGVYNPYSERYIKSVRRPHQRWKQAADGGGGSRVVAC